MAEEQWSGLSEAEFLALCRVEILKGIEGAKRRVPGLEIDAHLMRGPFLVKEAK